MDEKLEEYIKDYTSKTTGGRNSTERDSFKDFSLPNHGIGIEKFKDRINREDARTTGVVRVLGFKDEDKNNTEIGNLFLEKCISQERIIFNQCKKWHFKNHVNNRQDADFFDIYPYWITLEALLLCKTSKGIESIEEREFMAFIAVIRERNEINKNIKILEFLRNNPADRNEFYSNIPDQEKFFKRFTRNGFNLLLSNHFEYISYDKEKSLIYLCIKSTDFLSSQIEYFYSKYDVYTDYNSPDYLNFLRSNTIDNHLNIFPMPEKEITKDMISNVREGIKNNFPYKNLLLKGVPGTGKSKELIDKIRENIFCLQDEKEENECLTISELIDSNVIKVNVHSGLTNSELMQGIGVKTTTDNDIKYHEKQGLVLEHIAKAILNPSLPYVVVLEEVQENSLNRLIGDLIFLIEENRRVKFKDDHPQLMGKPIDYQLVSRLTIKHAKDDKIKLPSLVEVDKEIHLCIPENLYLFCTSNYRDDKKIMEDNLFRRFDVIEMFPDSTAIED